MKYDEIAIVGGDARMAWMALRLLEEGRHIRLAAIMPPAELRERLPEPEEALPLLRESRTVIFPVPCCDKAGFLRAPSVEERYAWADCLRELASGSLVIAGGLTQEMLRMAKEHGIETVDLLLRPELAELNAIATAEGAVAIAMKEMSGTLFDARCMVIGYGRCGSALAKRLGALGARVIATARRKEQLARIYADGFFPCPTSQLAEKIGGCEAVFNTVPAAVLNRRELERLSPGAVLIDLASEPGGVDRTSAAALGHTPIQALGLPGKVAPRTAGEHLQRVVVDLLSEREDMN